MWAIARWARWRPGHGSRPGGDFYLCPLAEVTLPPAVLEDYLEPMAMGQQALTHITRLTAASTRQHIAHGYEQLETLTAEVARGGPHVDRTATGGALAPTGPRRSDGTARAAGQGPGRGGRAARSRGSDPDPVPGAGMADSAALNGCGSTRCGAMATHPRWCGWDETRRWRLWSPPCGSHRHRSAGLAGLCHQRAARPALPGTGRAGLPQPIPGGERHGPAEGHPLSLTPM